MATLPMLRRGLRRGLVGAFEVVDFFDDVDPDAAEPDFFGVERFLEGPHVVMTLNTVPRGCHTEP